MKILLIGLEFLITFVCLFIIFIDIEKIFTYIKKIKESRGK